MSERVSPEKLRALAARPGAVASEYEGDLRMALGSAADTIEALTAENNEMRAVLADRVDERRDRTSAFLARLDQEGEG